MGQCYKTFYGGNLLAFHNNYQGTVALKHQMRVLQWKSGKLPW